MATFAIYTLGCKVNYYESTAIAEKLKAHGLTELEFSDIADVYIVNTCAVTGESERKARQMIRRAKKINPDGYVIVTGCSAQISADRIAAIGADYICGNKEKLRAAEAAIKYADGLADKKQTVIYDDLSDAGFEPMKVSRSDRTRAYIKIGDGCDGKCAYCVIRTARGPVRSKPIADVVSEARALAASGYREIVLTAIEISAYGKDIPGEDLASLINALSGIEGLERIRLGSLDPAMLTADFIDKIKDVPELAPHFHLSLQSGCDRTLAAMRRKYNTAMIKERVGLLRRAFPDAMFTADVIVGFPGESDDDFKASAEFLRSLDLLFMHIFTFSPRPGTEAAVMPCQIDEKVKNERSAALAGIRLESAEKCMSRYIGKVLPVIFEEQSGEYMSGHTANFIEVRVPSDADLHGEKRNVLFTEVDEYAMKGIIV